MKNIFICLFILSGLWLSSCSHSGVKVEGRFVGNDNKTIYLETVLPGYITLADSASTDENGNFSMKINLPDGQPTIYNLICNGQSIPLLLSPGEKVKLYAIGNIYRNYTIEGSEGSEQMRNLKEIVSKGSAKLDSILNVYSTVDEGIRKSVAAEYTSEYYNTKRNQISFIVSNAGSLAGLYALYQRLPNDPDLFNGKNDIIYYKLVADSISQIYPDSPYVKALQKEIANAESQLEKDNMLMEKISAGGIGFPDISMSDMYGKKHTLSELGNKVILLDFWAATMPDAAMLNAELKDIYKEFAPQGFEIYQVSVDELKPAWVTAVQEQKLPWISVCDFKGAASIAARNYNIVNIPSNFIIDKEGNIVAKDLYGEELRKKIKSLL